MIYFSIFGLMMVGCVPQQTLVYTQTSVFHSLQNPMNGITYAIIPNKEQESSLEFKAYANAIKGKLNQFGMIEVDPINAIYKVSFVFGIDNGREIESSVPIFGQNGASTFAVIGAASSSDTIYKRVLNIDIFDSRNIKDGFAQKVYEGKSLSEGHSNSLAEVVPSMIECAFYKFPATSGSKQNCSAPLKSH